jgi:glutathione S-transferase
MSISSRDVTFLAIGAAACGLGVWLQSKLAHNNSSKKIKFEYFNIFGAGEKVRLALALSDISWEDVRVTGETWRGPSGRKTTARYGQLPIMTIEDGGHTKEVYQSDAMLRYVGSVGNANLYPTNPIQRLKIDEALGLIADLDRSWRPCLAVGFNPKRYGHSGDLNSEAKSALLENIREMWMSDEMPKYMKFFTEFIDRNGGIFMCGNQLCIADLQAAHKLNYFRLGFADHVPKTSLDQYPKIIEYIDNVMNEPRVQKYYQSMDNIDNYIFI